MLISGAFTGRGGRAQVSVAGSGTDGGRRTLILAAQAGLEVSVAEDRGPGDDDEEELYAAFAALGGPLTGDELRRFSLDRLLRLLGSAEGRPAVVRQASWLLGGDIAAAEAVVQDSVAAVKDAWSRLGDLAQARLYFWRAVLNRSRSVRRHERDGDHSVAAARGAGHESIDDLGQETGSTALHALPERQLEAVVLHCYVGLSGKQAATAMAISTGAARSHLARGMASLRHPPPPD
jgi:DNA-directed RNA polymerase specialized sigma24 family protein